MHARPEYSVRAFYRLPSPSELHISRCAASENGAADENYSSEAVIFLSEMKDATLSEAAIQVCDVASVSPNTVRFSLTSDSVAPLVALWSDCPGRFSDNLLLLLPWEKKEIVFKGDGPLKAEDFEASLDIISMNDMQGHQEAAP
ncbi:unnamed protein product [Ostreobium quekettii]|uniref:Beta-mannosidase Ig-fold domain-containing protein n=1 Tax=Ostreobium quekettii TaxID=121088 RepID=A0A8S1J3N8_9CHLO|nr:unnamed protein product [Ostreobium quekettii]